MYNNTSSFEYEPTYFSLSIPDEYGHMSLLAGYKSFTEAMRRGLERREDMGYQIVVMEYSLDFGCHVERLRLTVDHWGHMTWEPRLVDVPTSDEEEKTVEEGNDGDRS